MGKSELDISDLDSDIQDALFLITAECCGRPADGWQDANSGWHFDLGPNESLNAIFDSNHISAYATAILMLGRLGLVTIKEDDGMRQVVAELTAKGRGLQMKLAGRKP